MRHGSALMLALVPALLQATPEIAPGFAFVPETPFRGDAIDLREPYDSEEFLDIFSYRRPFAWEEQWDRSAMKFGGVAGSTSKDEFWVDERIQFAYDLTTGLRFWARAMETEDFDSRYRRFEVGLDGEVLSWLWVGVYGEVLAEKGEDDLGARVILPRVLGQKVTLGLELPDALMNRKGGDLALRYARLPQSYYVDVEGSLGPRVAWHWGIVGNAPLELEAADRLLDFRYGQLSAYGRARADLTERWTCVLYAAGEGVDKAYRPWDGSDFANEDYSRRAYQGRAELRCNVDPAITPYGGARIFRLEEKQRFLDENWPTDLYRHREYVAYVGVELALTTHLIFRPEVIGGWLDRVIRSAEPGGGFDSAHRWLGKASAPFELKFAPNAGIIASVSLDLDELSFGGGMVALQMTY
jgi:hypothetical protein